MPARRPPAHHRVGDVGMELQRIGRTAVTKRLHREANRPRPAARRPAADRSLRGATDRPAPARDRRPRARCRSAGSGNTRPRHGRRDAGRRGCRDGAPASARRGRCRETVSSPAAGPEPVDLAADEIVGVVRAHRAAEIDRAGVLRHGLGQRVAEARTAQVERIAALAQGVTDTPRRRSLLMHDDQDRLQHCVIMSSKRGLGNSSAPPAPPAFQDARPPGASIGR